MEQPALLYYHLDEGVTAFSTSRTRGYSKGQYTAFNINEYCGDDPTSILRNREALCALLGIEDNQLVMPHQVHRAEVAIIDESFWTLTNEERRQSLEGIDALMTQQSGVCIGVSTADCIPVLVYDHVQHVACAIHAGWRGTVLRIVMQAVKAMMSTYGSKPIDMTAQVGPGICLDSFEVGQEVYDAFLQAGFDMAILSRRQPSASGEEKWHIDLPLCNRQQLLSMGIPSHQITISSICTFKQYDTWFSARRLGIHSGRIFTGIMLHEKP